MRGAFESPLEGAWKIEKGVFASVDGRCIVDAVPSSRSASRRAALGLRFLGEIEVLRGAQRLALPPSKKTRALLAYLVVTGRPQRRDRLCTMFWDVADDPRAALRWSLSKLRPLVDEPARPRIVAMTDTVAFDAADADRRRVRPSGHNSAMAAA